MQSAIFTDRADAGRQLAAVLTGCDPDSIVMALPRGGVPVAFEIAKALRAPLDLLIVRKIGAPGQAEYGIGAVIAGANPQLVVNDDAMPHIKLPPGYLERAMQQQLKEIDRRRRVYLGNSQPIPLAGRALVLVDDGIATGVTIRAALKGLRQAKISSVVVAVPVAPQDILDLIAPEADSVVCLAVPRIFNAVGQFYEHFDQTSDREVVDLMAAAKAWQR